jgi:hypothetical protein
VKFKIGNDADRLDAIAQVKAECDGGSFFPMPDVVFYSFESPVCDRNNAAKGFDMPIIGILCDGMSFEFFSFDGKTRKFTRGCLPGDPAEYRCGLRLTDFTLDGPGRFIAGLRQICEIIFDLFMGAYISSLTSFRERSEWKGKKDGNPRKSLDEWDEALKHAQEAFGKFRAAETKRKGKDGERANTLVEEALYALELRYKIFTTLHLMLMYRMC